MITKVLVPIDGSDLSFKALKYGAEIAEKFNAKLTVLHVMPLLLDSLMQEVKEKGQSYMKKAEKILSGLTITYDTKFAYGSPAEEINKQASRGYNLIVIGSRGLGEIKGLLLGSVSYKISSIAKQPVLIVH